VETLKRQSPALAQAKHVLDGTGHEEILLL